MGSLGTARARVRGVGIDPARAGAFARPTVSVVVPVLDGEDFLRESLDSILEQTYAPTEVVIMDDGSTDSTPAIAASYGDRIRYVRQPFTRGIYGNANDGIAQASGELVGVFHADDVYLPEMLERDVEWLDRGGRRLLLGHLHRPRRERGRSPRPAGRACGRAPARLPDRPERAAHVQEPVPPLSDCARARVDLP